MTIYYGKQGFRLEVIDSAIGRKEDIIIIRLDLGKVFSLNKEMKTYKESSLNRDNDDSSKSIVSTIAGYNVNTDDIQSLNLFGFSGSIKTKLTLYPSKDLYYSVPDVFTNNPQLLMVRDNKIVLGAKLTFPAEHQWNLNHSIDPKSSNKDNITAIAYSVRSQKLDSTIFSIPQDYINASETHFYNKEEQQLKDSLDSIVKIQKQIIMSESNFDNSNQKAKKSTPKKKPATTKSTLHRKQE